MTRAPLAFAFLQLVFGQASLMAQTSDDGCAAVLALAGRDLTTKVDESDIRSYFYKQVCESQNTDAGATYQDVARAIGLSYSSKAQYCDEEKRYSTSHATNQLYVSTVVRASVDSWEQCKRFSKATVNLTSLDVQASTVSLNLARGHVGVAEVFGVDASAGTKCSAAYRDERTNKPVNVDLSARIGFPIPANASVSILCKRQPIPKPDEATALLYPASNIVILATPENFAIHLPEEPLADSAWAQDLRIKMQQLDQTVQVKLKNPVLICTAESVDLQGEHTDIPLRFTQCPIDTHHSAIAANGGGFDAFKTPRAGTYAVQVTLEAGLNLFLSPRLVTSDGQTIVLGNGIRGGWGPRWTSSALVRLGEGATVTVRVTNGGEPPYRVVSPRLEIHQVSE